MAAAVAPAARGRPSWRSLLTWAGARWVEADGEMSAAALAYFLLLSLLPLLVIVVSVYSLFVERAVASQSVVDLVDHYLPLTPEHERAAVATIRSVLDARGALGGAAAPLMVIGAVQFLRTMIRSTNHIWRLPAYSWWRLPLKSLGLLAIAVSIVLVGILLPSLAQLARPWLTATLASPTWMFEVLGDAMAGLVLFGGFTLIFMLAPSRITTFTEVRAGALVATAIIGSGELLFQLYFAQVVHLSTFYGALGGIVAFLMWTFMASCTTIFGVCLCAARAAHVGEPLS